MLKKMNQQLKEGFLNWPKSLEKACERAELFKSLKQKVSEEKKESSFTDLKSHCEKIKPLLRESSEIEQEGYSQVCFRGNPWSGLNSIPFALMALSIYKSYIVPAFSILLPFVTLLLPYIMLKVFYNIPIEFGEYCKLFWKMWNGQPIPRTPQELLNPPPVTETSPLTQIKQLVQNGWTLITFGQTMWQPIQQARHFRKIDSECVDLGYSVLQIKDIASALHKKYTLYFPSWFESWISMCPSSEREVFAFVIDTPFWLKHLLRAIGRFEVLYNLAKRPDVVPVEFVKASKPILMLKGFGDPHIPYEKRVNSTIKLEGHSIVTGPNRGGKSSFLRGVLTNVKFAHCFGACFAEKAQMTHFSWIANGLELSDKPGKTSMFEREIEFASGVLSKHGGFGLILYDELFHSTNPPDAQRSSEIFCEKLWKRSDCISVLSTHVYSLAENAPSSVKKLCVASWKNGEDYKFLYSVQKGVCKVSSVDLLLKQFGLL
jgi:hypothetical protein